MNRIDGKVALVTGGSQGLGKAIASQFAEAGARGIVICSRSIDKGEKVAREISSSTDTDVRFVRADLGNLEDVARVVESVDNAFGRVDVLVNAAALTDRGNLLNTTPELFDRMFAINVRAPFFLMQDCVKLMIRDGIEGAIVNIGSTSELAGQPFIAPYCASKGALATLTRNTAFALMRNRIRTNQLDIGWMASEHEIALQIEETGDPDWLDKVAPSMPFGRLLDPAEVARAVLWMASDDAGMMTGAVIHFDQSVWGAYKAGPPAPDGPLTL